MAMLGRPFVRGRNLAFFASVILVALNAAWPAWGQLGFNWQTAARNFKVRILQDAQVQADLKISPEQAKNIKLLFDKGEKALRSIEILARAARGQKLEELQKKLEEIGKESDPLAVDLLTEPQKKRLDQIIRQLQGAALYVAPELLAALRATPEQQEKFRTIQLQYATHSAPFWFGSFDDDKQLADLRKTYLRMAVDLLSAEQKQVWQELVGEPFQGVDTRRVFTIPFPMAVDSRKQIFGQYLDELTWLSGNRSIQAELQMTADQIRLAVESDDGLRNRFPANRTTARSSNYSSERSKVVEDSIRKILNPEQSARFRQIMLQASTPSSRNGRFGNYLGASAAAYPGVAEEIKLTNEQKERLIAGEIASRVLTVEQSALIAKMLGKPFREDYTAGREWYYKVLVLQDAKVQSELKINPEQAEKIKSLPDKLEKALQSIASLAFAERGQKREELQKESDLLAVGLLTGPQNKRLDQIIRQQRGGALYLDPELLAALRATPEQQEKFRTIEERYSATPYPYRPNPNDQKALIQMRATCLGMAGDLLSAEQKQVWQDLVGEPYQGGLRADSRGVDETELSASGLLVDCRRKMFGQYLNELRLLSTNGSIQTDLKMTPEQIRLAEAAHNPRSARSRLPVTKFSERSKVIEDSLREILSPEQSARFRQIMLQYYELGTNRSTDSDALEMVLEDQRDRFRQILPRHSSPRSSWPNGAVQAFQFDSAAAYPGMAEEVKLTDEQEQRLIAGESASRVLTAEQSAMIAKMLGEPFRGDFAARRSGPRRTVISASAEKWNFKVWILQDAQVQADLKISPEQAEKIKSLCDKWEKALRSLVSLALAERNQRREELRKESDPLAVELLTEPQKKRLDQITRQLRGAAMYVAPELLAALRATPEQQEKFRTIEYRYATQSRPSGFARADEDKQSVELRKTCLGMAVDLLSAEQKQVWQELVGEPFQGVDPRRVFTGALSVGVDYRKQTFGQYRDELTRLSANRSIQAELKMTADQIRLAAEAVVGLQKTFPANRSNYSSERSRVVEDALRKVLNPEQSARFRQIMLQSCELPAAYSGVAEEVKLTDEQKQRLIAGEAASRVLTAEQSAMIAKMLGEPFREENVFRVNPSDWLAPAALFDQYMAQDSAGESEQAFKTIMEALALVPNSDAYLAHASHAEHKTGRHAEGVKHALEAIKINPRVGWYYASVAFNAYGNKDVDLAREYCRKAIELGVEKVGQTDFDQVKKILAELDAPK